MTSLTRANVYRERQALTWSLARRSPMVSTISPANTGWVSVGIDHDTAGFAVNAIRGWHTSMGQERYP